jgi:hypothetical protein
VAIPFDAMKTLIIIVILTSILLAGRTLPAVSLEQGSSHGTSPWRFRLAR